MLSALADRDRHAVIVGGGIAGVAAFIKIVATAKAHAVTIIDGHAEGEGSGFFAADDRLLCNTSVETMSVVHGRPGDFLSWLSESGIEAAGGDFVSRRLVSDYVRSRYAAFRLVAAQKGIGVRRVTGTASRIEASSGGRYRVVLCDGAEVAGTHVLVCIGNGRRHVPEELLPYARGRNVLLGLPPGSAPLAGLAPQSRVLVLGARLSAVDAALLACGEGHTAVLASPSGQLPAVRTGTPLHLGAAVGLASLDRADPFSPAFRRSFLREVCLMMSGAGWGRLSHHVARSTDALGRLRREADLAKAGRTAWQSSLAALLETGNRSLAAMDPARRATLLRSLAPLVGRYLFAFPLQSAEALLRFADDGRFSIRADRLTRMRDVGSRWRVSFGSGHAEDFDAVICAAGYEKATIRADGGAVHLTSGIRADAPPARVTRDLRLLLQDRTAAERIWLCGACAHPAAPLVNAVFQFVRQADETVEAWAPISLAEPGAAALGRAVEETIGR